MKQILETERLLLRELTEADFSALCRTLQDEKAMTAYEHGFSDEEVRDWLQKQLRRYRADGIGLWAVIRKEDGVFLGQCGLTRQDIGNRVVAEIGYLLERAFWHCGYATEAAIACREYAFSVLGEEEVYAIVRDTNLASRNVALRVGMKKRGSIVKHYYGLDMPHDLYAVRRDRT